LRYPGERRLSARLDRGGAAAWRRRERLGLNSTPGRRHPARQARFSGGRLLLKPGIVLLILWILRIGLRVRLQWLLAPAWNV
jgi:hypothetical protein